MEDLEEGLPRAGPMPWWVTAIGKGARKHGHGHGKIKAKHQAEVRAAANLAVPLPGNEPPVK